MATAAEKESLRGGIESTHNKIRHDRERQYAQDQKNLEDAYLADLITIRRAKEAHMRAAGLNSDGSDPQGRPTA